ncbi:MAG: hypothetical protein H5U01_09695 [Clostridia bacterium]|nr:hypothetical protein [Clostridia bacterium]MBC7352836.1 hypothetical protein [Thermogutta sp.]
MPVGEHPLESFRTLDALAAGREAIDEVDGDAVLDERAPGADADHGAVSGSLRTATGDHRKNGSPRGRHFGQGPSGAGEHFAPGFGDERLAGSFYGDQSGPSTVPAQRAEDLVEFVHGRFGQLL